MSKYKSDLEIANSAIPQKIALVAAKLGLTESDIEPYGHFKAKIARTDIKKFHCLSYKLHNKEKCKNDGCGDCNDFKDSEKSKLILVTAINPTPMGEGKTTVSIGLADGMAFNGKKVCLALREPSLGPVFGIKGGAAGGGHSQVIPMEDINLHFTGDIHAVTSANNLISAILDNSLQQGNPLNIDPRKIVWKRCVDLNDRALRGIVCGLGGALNGIPREDGFTITAASEVMAILCLASDLEDLKQRIASITVGYTYDDTPVSVADLGCADAAAILLKDAVKPNLVQTLEGTPAIVHGGPFANIAHGCNSIIATKTAMSLADYVVTEAGFGADLGAEKFLDIKCRAAGLDPDCVVLVATVRALKYNGGAERQELTKEDLTALENGIPNLLKHIENMKNVFGMNVVVAINKFVTDTDNEIALLKTKCAEYGADAVVTEAWEFGGRGAAELAEKVAAVCNTPSKLNFAYDTAQDIEVKIRAVAERVYGAAGVEFSAKAKSDIAKLKKSGADKLPVCIAKTQYSLSDDPAKLGRPEGFILNINEVIPRTGAGFAVCQAGSMLLMPGLSAVPAAVKMTIDKDGKIEGLF